MNKQDKKWICEKLYLIWELDEENDGQIEDTTDFLADLAQKVNYDEYRDNRALKEKRGN